MYNRRTFLFFLLSFSFFDFNAGNTRLSDNTKLDTKQQQIIQKKHDQQQSSLKKNGLKKTDQQQINKKQTHYKRKDNRFGNKYSLLSACWHLWYNLRKKIIYPIDNLIYCLNCGQESPVVDLRKKIYTQCLRAIGYNGAVSDPALVGMQCGVGIADAWAADKSTRMIVKEDIVAFGAFYAFLAGLDLLYENVIINEAIMPPYVSKTCQTLDTSMNAVVIWKGIKLLIKGYIATWASDIIAEPITYFMYDNYDNHDDELK